MFVGADAVNAAARTVNGFTRAVVGVVNDGARVIGAVVNRTDAAVLALTTASVDATRNAALASANALGLAAAL